MRSGAARISALLDRVSKSRTKKRDHGDGGGRSHFLHHRQEDDVSEPAAAAPKQEEAPSEVAEAKSDRKRKLEEVDAVVEANGAGEDANRLCVEGNVQGFSIGLIALMATSFAQSTHA